MRPAIQSSARLLSLMLLAVMLPAGAPAATGDCGLPLSSTTPRSSDCLYVLRAAVKLETCAPCTCDVDASDTIAAGDALLCLRFAVGQDVVLTCPPCVECPDRIEWTTHAGIGDACATDTDCDAGTCDQELGRCRTASELDLGWTGRGHDATPTEGAVLRAIVACDGDGQSCGVCEIAGIDETAGHCRCASDSRVACDTPFVANEACPSCAGGALAGLACTEDADCDAGTCARYCAFDPEIACTTNTDCPFGRRKCLDEPRCGSPGGAPCASDDDCTGTCTASAVCECYDAPPQPVASVTFPFCIVPRLASDLTGTVDIETGDSVIVRDLQLRAFGAVSLRTPCPVCGGTCSSSGAPCAASDDCEDGEDCSLADVPGDGERDGTCVGGEHHGLSCDVAATHPSFPPGGGGTSLDCLPERGADFTGNGLRGVDLETTGTTALAATLDCDPGSPGATLCPCLVCTGGDNAACRSDDDCGSLHSCDGLADRGCATNTDCEGLDLGVCTAFEGTRCTKSLTTPCATNADCTAVDVGPCRTSTCASAGIGVVPQPNDCLGACSAGDDGEGSCATGPDDRFCDGLVEADGTGVRHCFTNADCGAAAVGFDAGSCTLVERRDCFADPIAADGDADPGHPLYVGAFCVSPTTSVGANAALGLPGPARIRRQTSLQPILPASPAEGTGMPAAPRAGTP